MNEVHSGQVKDGGSSFAASAELLAPQCHCKWPAMLALKLLMSPCGHCQVASAAGPEGAGLPLKCKLAGWPALNRRCHWGQV